MYSYSSLPVLFLLLLAYLYGDCSLESDSRPYDACDSYEPTNPDDPFNYYREFWPSADAYYNFLEKPETNSDRILSIAIEF